MKFNVKNKDLSSLLQIIDKLSTTSMRVNRGKAKVYSAVSNKLQEYRSDEEDILKENVVIDDSGQLARQEDGNFILKEGVNVVDVNQQLLELQEETITISSGDYTNRFTDFLNWLLDCEEVFTTQEVILVDNLLEQFEEQKGE
ncbi:TPA: DUF1617 family protein [Streptococcus suis]